MKKVYKIEDLDCAHCAAIIEENISKIEGVKAVSVNFVMQKLVIEAEDEKFDEIMEKAKKIAKKIEPDCKIV